MRCMNAEAGRRQLLRATSMARTAAGARCTPSSLYSGSTEPVESVRASTLTSVSLRSSAKWACTCEQLLLSRCKRP